MTQLKAVTAKLRTLTILICLPLLIGALSACGNAQKQNAPTEPKAEQTAEAGKAKTMNLYFNDVQIPVSWEDNAAVKALAADAEKTALVVAMKMARGNEQVGSLGKDYPASDKYITAVSGDLVLYDSDKLVVLYGSNPWYYTRLGRVKLPREKLTELLSQGNITLRLSY